MKNIVVVGSGVMGSGIAEQIANAGFKVHLLDIVPENANDRNILAKQAISKTKVIMPENIIPGNLEDDLAVFGTADWVIEVIIEKLSIKQSLYTNLEKYCPKTCIISSNTSTIPLRDLIKERSNKFKENFLITHFFNPPRYMPLLEIVTSSFTKKNVIEKISNFTDIHLGKTIIKSNDTPGFIANRIGCYWLETALSLAIEMQMSVEEVDYLMSGPLGIPRTGIFGLYDLIGLDVMQLITKSLSANLAKDDDFLNVSKPHNLTDKMLNEGFTGRKGKGGFYKIEKDQNNNKIKQVINLSTGEYRQEKRFEALETELTQLINSNIYVAKVLAKTLSYTVNLVPEVSDNISEIDQAMKLGYNWKFGPFELIDKIGIKLFKEKLQEFNIKIPGLLLALGERRFYQNDSYFNGYNYIPLTKPEGVIFLQDFTPSIYENSSAQILDLRNDIAAIELTSKMGLLNHNVFNLILDFFDKYSNNFKAVIIANKQTNFSIGGDLKFMLEMAEEKNWSAIDEYLKLGQNAMSTIKNSPIPVISALNGMALGGGSELLLHSSFVVAHIETNSGLVEAGVGLIPGWGGCAELILRTTNTKERINAFENIVSGRVSSSAYELKEMLKIPNLQICMNPNRVLQQSRELAISNISRTNYQTNSIILKIDFEPIISEFKGYNQIIAKELANLFNTENLNKDFLFAKEREIFIKLLGNEATQERIKYMLKNGKRLEN